VIPHAGGLELLVECLEALASTRGVELEAIVVDNGSKEEIGREALDALPTVQILRYECRLGFAAACNRGVEAAGSEFILLLNNDAVVEPDTLSILSEAMSADRMLAACQPKILSLTHPGRFDYSSAAGGEIDRYGFPFARGRVFDTIEEDRGQYDRGGYVFWGAGAALMLRRERYLAAGGLEEPFFAHMEEIDLAWRFQLMGYRVASIPEAVVRHRGAATIHSGSFIKMYLNYRNSLATLVRNYSTASLTRYLPGRLALDMALALHSLITLNFLQFWAVFRAGCWFLTSFPYLIRGRRSVQRLRQVPDRAVLERIYPGSVAWQYFIRKRRTWSELYQPLE